MSDKYSFTANNNSTCPICSSRIQGIGPPVIYLKDSKKFKQSRWCHSCFNRAQELLHSDYRVIKTELLPRFTELIASECIVKGFQFSLIPKQGLTLVLEVTDAEERVGAR